MRDGADPSPPRLVARPAAPADAAAIAAIHLEAWRVAYAHVFGSEALGRLPPPRERELAWRDALTAPAPRAHVGVAGPAGDVPVGFAAWSPSRDADGDPRATAELCALYVLPSAWRGGVGRLLMEGGLARSRADGFARATLWVVEDNARARRFYEAGGWRLEGTRKLEEVLGRRVAEVRYEIGLGGSPRREVPADRIPPQSPGGRT